ATLTVPTPPQITVQPTNLTVNGGAPVTLSVVATGDLPLIYQWQLNGTNVPAATNANLSFTSAQNSNAGPYQVVITNSSGSVTSAVATLTVNAGPTIVTQPLSQTVPVGSSVTFSVSALGPSLTYQWLFYDTNIIGATAPTFTRSSVQMN